MGELLAVYLLAVLQVCVSVKARITDVCRLTVTLLSLAMVDTLLLTSRTSIYHRQSTARRTRSHILVRPTSNYGTQLRG